MAGRPEKHTVDYFPHDANASQGRTLSILFNHFQHEGVSAWWHLLERISSTNNHIIDIRTSEDFEFLATVMRFTPERLRQLLDKMAELAAIDPELYKNGVIWSQNLVTRLEPVYKSRKQDLPSKPQLSSKEMQFIGKEMALLVKANPPPQTETKRTSITPPKTKLKELKEVEREEVKEPAPATLKDIFFSFENNNGYKDIDFLNEFKKFTEYWKTPPDKPELAAHRWLDKCLEKKADKKPRDTSDPDKFIKGKYGHAVQR